jgi:hypothetical protein
VSYLVSTILWTFGGICIGFILGFIVRGVVVRRAPAAVIAEDAPRRRRSPGVHWDILRPLVGLLILGLIGYTVWAQTSQATCQKAANRQFQSALSQRAAAAKESNDAQRQFLTSLARPGATPGDKAAAMQTYLDALNAQDQAQAANPLVVNDDCQG